MTNRSGGIQALGAHIDAVLDAVAAEYAEGIVEPRQPLIS